MASMYVRCQMSTTMKQSNKQQPANAKIEEMYHTHKVSDKTVNDAVSSALSVDDSNLPDFMDQ